MLKIGILHPGEMGISIAASALQNEHDVFWVPEGRSSATQARAVQFGLKDAQTLAQLCEQCTLILSGRGNARCISRWRGGHLLETGSVQRCLRHALVGRSPYRPAQPIR